VIAADEEGTLPRPLTTGQVWVQPGGGLLLEVPLRQKGEEVPADSPPDRRALEFLARTAVLALEGRPRAGARNVRAPLPEHATRLLNRLLGGPRPFRDAAEFRAELERIRTRPAEVTHGLRAAQIVVLGASVFVGVVCMLVAGWLAGVLMLIVLRETQKEVPEVVRNLEAGTARDFVSTLVAPDPLVRAVNAGLTGADLDLAERVRRQSGTVDQELLAREQGADWPSRAVYRMAEQLIERRESGQGPDADDSPGTGDASTDYRGAAARWVREAGSAPKRDGEVRAAALAIIGIFPALWVASALLFRGGVIYPLMGLSLVRADGRRAGRLRCAWRALLVWAPLAGLLAGGILLDEWYWYAAPTGRGHAWVLWLAESLRWAALALLAVYPVLAIRSPRQCLHDRLAGTFLVPR
jgi:hypothetical protein